MLYTICKSQGSRFHKDKVRRGEEECSAAVWKQQPFYFAIPFFISLFSNSEAHHQVAAFQDGFHKLRWQMVPCPFGRRQCFVTERWVSEKKKREKDFISSISCLLHSVPQQRVYLWPRKVKISSQKSSLHVSNERKKIKIALKTSKGEERIWWNICEIFSLSNSTRCVNHWGNIYLLTCEIGFHFDTWIQF